PLTLCRRIALSVTLGTVGVVVLLVLVAIFSPILALRTVSVAGANRVDGAAVAAVVEEQLGTPLALIDYGRLDAGLRAFPVIRSYTTEVVPPDTMVVHLVEREPVVTIASPAGDFLFVDAAGVTVQASKERLPGVPLVTESGTALPNPAFDAAVEVLLAMPDELRGQIDTITAKTRDDVWLTFAGVTQAVKWGSADDSATKVRLLEVLRANFGATPGTFDVSATGNGIFRPA
ncbi:MAG: FtsQ-type POTRA domain-containing protein, partial [Microbacteriaceae bacterium]|nr:FtsQ-type POTRA domain-containing protein [Microbacteriaceae bacterium]